MRNNVNTYACVCLLFAVSLDLIGGRWAAYLRSPIPGIYFPDFLYLTAIFFIASRRENILNLFKSSSYATSLVALISIGFIAIKFGLGQFYYHEKFSYVIRDGALLFFFATAPLIALVIKEVGDRKIMTIIRWSGLIYVGLFILVYLGLITPFHSIAIGSEHVRIFEFGGDLVGVVCGITFLFWSDPVCNKKMGSLAKILSIAPLIVSNSRGSALAMIVVIIFTILFVTRNRWKTEVLIILIGLSIGFAISIKGVASYHGVPIYSSNLNTSNLGKSDNNPSSAIAKFLFKKDVITEATRSSERLDKKIPPYESDGYFEPVILPFGLQGWIEAHGTASARLATWKIVIEYLIRKNMIVAGAPYGSQTLFLACSNPKLPTYGAQYPGGGAIGPKCPVDSNETYSPTRDAHNFVVTLLIYNGLVGVFVFFALLFTQARRFGRLNNGYKIYAVIVLIGYCISGLFSTFASSPFVMVPCAFMLGWLQSEGKSNA